MRFRGHWHAPTHSVMVLKELFGCCRRQNARSDRGPHFSIDEMLTLDDDFSHKPEDFTYVGVGGQFVKQTNYNYVGDGSGEFNIPARQGRGWRLCAALTTVIVACSLIAVLIATIRYGNKLVAPGHDPVRDDRAAHGDRWQSRSGYDCVAGYSNWESGWSLGKKTWCCNHHQRGCEGNDKPLMQFDCVANIQNWATGWSAIKKKWCCRHLPTSCMRPTQPAKTTTEVPYNCKAGPDIAIGNWSKEKRIWCCLHVHRGCPTANSDLKGSVSSWGSGASRSSSSSSSMNQQFAPRTVLPASEACDSSCADRQGLSATCRTRLRIVATEEFAGQAYACERAAEQVGQQCTVCRGCQLGKEFCDDLMVSKAGLKSNFSLLHDCLAGFANWEQSWSGEKKAWCCKHGGRGCSQKEPHQFRQQDAQSTTSAAAGWMDALDPMDSVDPAYVKAKRADTAAPSRPASSAAHSKPAPSKAARSTTDLAEDLAKAARSKPGPSKAAPSADFDCIEGLSSWKDTWSKNKKAWCCGHTGHGCPKQDGKFDCVAGYANWEVGWSLDKKAWCCQHHKRGCPPQMTSVPYNCNDGFFNWKRGWSAKKKDWCCRNTGRGCVSVAS